MSKLEIIEKLVELHAEAYSQAEEYKAKYFNLQKKYEQMQLEFTQQKSKQIVELVRKSNLEELEEKDKL